MDMPPLEAHSVAEAHLYLMVTPCKLCGTGRTRCSEHRPADAAPGSPLVLHCTCEGCGFESEFHFELPVEAAKPGNSDSMVAARINPTEVPSRIIDVAQWLTLFRVVTEAAAGQADKAESRVLGYEAAQCLEEALKFYDAQNDLPPAGAFYHDRSRRQLQEHPELFARQRLVGLRGRLPTLTDMERRLMSGGHARPQRWWKLW